MKPIPTRRPSPALVISVVALIVALGGTGYAAMTLPKNSVGRKQLRKGSVTGRKVKNHSLTGADLNLAKLGTVPAAVRSDQAGNADSAANATHAGSSDSATNATHAGSSDSATNATHAGSADTASDATNASTVGGVTVKAFSYQTASSGGAATLFALNGLTLTATCSTGRVDATTSVDNAYISAEWIKLGNTAVRAADTDFDTADTLLTSVDTGPKTGSIEYVRPDGQRVSVILQADMASACTVSGHAFGSG